MAPPLRQGVKAVWIREVHESPRFSELLLTHGNERFEVKKVYFDRTRTFEGPFLHKPILGVPPLCAVIQRVDGEGEPFTVSGDLLKQVGRN